MGRMGRWWGAVVAAWFMACAAQAVEPIPDRLVVLTFDDANLTDLTIVAPALSRYGFRATFFVTEGFQADRQNYMTWEEIARLHRAGFEIGNHTRSHRDSRSQTKAQFVTDIEALEARCKEQGIPAPQTFCYPGYRVSGEAVKALQEKGYRFARRGCEPMSTYLGYDRGGRGPAYDPARDHPLLIPTTGASGPEWSLDDLAWAVSQAKNGKIAVLTFHGVPDIHPWCSTQPAELDSYLKYLRDQRCTVIAMGDLAKYVDLATAPQDPIGPLVRQVRLTPEDLSTEYLANPLGLDVPQPRFSWKCASSARGQSQTAYQILVAGSVENLRADRGDLWDSGKVVSGESVNVPYQGKPLVSGQTCFWKVRCWNKPDPELLAQLQQMLAPPFVEPLRSEAAGPDSSTATFEMGLLRPEDWLAKWISAEQGVSAPLLRKEFQVRAGLKRARAYVAGIGYHELHLNGQKVGDRVLDPASTLFDNGRLPELKSRVLYVTHDITRQLQPGANAMGVMLGHGWYSADPKTVGRVPYGDRPKLRMQIHLEYEDGARAVLTTDETWKTSPGPILANDICRGETYDARAEQPGWNSPAFDDAAWKPALKAAAPSGELRAQTIPPTRVVQHLPAANLLEPKEGVYVYDFGQHFSGWTRFQFAEHAGATVTLKYAGAIHDDGRLDQRNNLGAEQTDRYTFRGDARETFEPRFTLHGFRYVEVTGLTKRPKLADLEGCFVRTDLPTRGEFQCSHPLLNQIHRNVCWTLMSSFQGIPQDAADRDERLGWMGDPGFMADSYFYNYDTVAFWTKWLDDIRDSQKLDGDVPEIVPPHLGMRYSFLPAWKSTYPLFVWFVYQYHGDRRILEQHFEGMQKLVDFLGRKAENHILVGGLGDHMEPQPEGFCNFTPKHTPVPLTSTAYYFRDVEIVANSARILGKTAEAERYARLADEIRAAYNRKFFNPETNQYGTGSQTSNALSLHLGLVPEDRRSAVVKNLVDDVQKKHGGHLSTGIIGTNALQQALPDHGRADVMFQIATRTTFPSWGFQIRHGATTVWETFDVNPKACLNMKMFCSTEKFFFADLAGLSPAAPGWERITIRPRPCGDLTFARASVETPRGLAAVAWRIADNAFQANVSMPVNAAGKVELPKRGLADVVLTEGGTTIWKSGKTAQAVYGIRELAETQEAVTFTLGSGRYTFQLTGKAAPNPPKGK